MNPLAAIPALAKKLRPKGHEVPFHAPSGQEENVETLAVWVDRSKFVEDGPEQTVLRSYWSPSLAELEHLNAGGLIELSIFGSGHPVVGIQILHDSVEVAPL